MKSLLLLFALSMLKTAMATSPLQINGAESVTCLPATRLYSVPIAADDDIFKGAIWHWEVTGGHFQDGGTLMKGKGVATITVHWESKSSQVYGSLKLSIIKGEKVISELFKRVYLGTPEPLGIKLEGGLLDCEGNWFTLLTRAPLDGSETIEWEVENGLDETGVPIRFLSKSGQGAHRIFLTRAEQDRPLNVSARVLPGCPTAGRASEAKSQMFRNPPPKLVGPRTIEAGQEANFQACLGPTGSNGQQWFSTGAVTQVGDASASIYFPVDAVGRTETVELTIEDCGGNEEKLTLEIKVVSPRKETGLPDSAKTVGPLDYRVFPNPAGHGLLYIEVREDFESGRADLLDFQGRLLRSEELGTSLTRIETSGIPAGLYLVRVRTEGKEAISRVGINLYD